MTTKGGTGSEFIVVTILHIVKDYDHILLIGYCFICWQILFNLIITIYFNRDQKQLLHHAVTILNPNPNGRDEFCLFNYEIRWDSSTLQCPL
jgi:hypothetical protein